MSRDVDRKGVFMVSHCYWSAILHNNGQFVDQMGVGLIKSIEFQGPNG